MAKKIELIMPRMGESINEATILKWMKQEGDAVEMDEPIIEIATDKVDSEVPSPVNGKIIKTLCNEGDVIEVGKAVAIIETEDEVDADIPVVDDDGEKSSAKSETKDEPTKEKADVNADAVPAPKAVSKQKSGRFYSPLVLNIARSEGISMDELESLDGSGKDGRVTKKDILAYVENRGDQATTTDKVDSKQTASTKTEAPTSIKSDSQIAGGFKQKDVPVYPGDEVIEMDRMRKMISENMSYSKHISPHVTSFVEADVTNIVKWREKNKAVFLKQEGEKLTYTPLFIEAVIKAIKDFPMINISISGDKIIKRKELNIGMAAALPNGNLIVPVIRNADHKNLIGLTKSVNDLAVRARENKLKPEEIQGGTFTLTNVGTFGNLSGTPVILQPQVAILATGAIQKKPAVIETDEGDMIAIRHMMFLSLSYDHRIVDGALGGGFLRRVADYLEDFDSDKKF